MCVFAHVCVGGNGGECLHACAHANMRKDHRSALGVFLRYYYICLDSLLLLSDVYCLS